MITWGRLRRFGWIGAFLVVVGCTASEGAAPTVSPVRPTSVLTSGPSATATTSQTSAPDEVWARVPKAARVHTYAGAQAFAEFYLEQTNEAWSRPDWRTLVPLATSGCKSCSNYVETAKSLLAKHQHYDGDSVMVRSSAWLPESNGSTAYVSIVAVQLPARIVDSRGATVERVSQQNGISEFEVVWRTDRWLINAIRLMENP